MLIESYLPIFPGFAYTLWEPADYIVTEDGDERSLTDEEHEAFDNQAYETAVATLAVHAIEGQLKRLNSGVSKVIFEKIWSPKYYNYDNDAIYVTYQLNKQKFSKYIKELIKTHLAQWEKFLLIALPHTMGLFLIFQMTGRYRKQTLAVIPFLNRKKLRLYLNSH